MMFWLKKIKKLPRFLQNVLKIDFLDGKIKADLDVDIFDGKIEKIKVKDLYAKNCIVESIVRVISFP